MIHGSWHWGGCFQKVADRLSLVGFPVVTPDLTSHGYDASAYDGFSTMAEYAAPAEAIVEASPAPVILIGHSMGGVTLTYLAEKYPDKIAKLIYLSAFMVPTGRRALDYVLLNLEIPIAAELFKVVSQTGDGRGLRLDLANRELLKRAFYADCTDHDIDIAARNVLPVTSTVPDLHVSEATAARWGRIPRVYIECTLDNALPIETQRLMISENPGTTVASIESSHSPFFSQPDRLTEIILSQCIRP